MNAGKSPSDLRRDAACEKSPPLAHPPGRFYVPAVRFDGRSFCRRGIVLLRGFGRQAQISTPAKEKRVGVGQGRNSWRRATFGVW